MLFKCIPKLIISWRSLIHKLTNPGNLTNNKLRISLVLKTAILHKKMHVYVIRIPLQLSVYFSIKLSSMKIVITTPIINLFIRSYLSPSLIRAKPNSLCCFSCPFNWTICFPLFEKKIQYFVVVFCICKTELLQCNKLKLLMALQKNKLGTTKTRTPVLTLGPSFNWWRFVLHIRKMGG